MALNVHIMSLLLSSKSNHFFFHIGVHSFVCSYFKEVHEPLDGVLGNFPNVISGWTSTTD